MTDRDIPYFYSTRSIYAYLGAARAVALATRHRRRLIHKPINLARLLEGIGGVPFDRRPAAAAKYFFGREIERWAEYLNIPALVDPRHHVGDRLAPSGFVIAAQRLGLDADALHVGILQALWRDDRDIADPAVLAEIARAAGLDSAPLLAHYATKPVLDEFAANTEEAIRLGVLGSPTYFVDGDMFYGQDRLDHVARALERPFRPTSGKVAV